MTRSSEQAKVRARLSLSTIYSLLDKSINGDEINRIFYFYLLLRINTSTVLLPDELILKGSNALKLVYMCALYRRLGPLNNKRPEPANLRLASFRLRCLLSTARVSPENAIDQYRNARSRRILRQDHSPVCHLVTYLGRE